MSSSIQFIKTINTQAIIIRNAKGLDLYYIDYQGEKIKASSIATENQRLKGGFIEIKKYVISQIDKNGGLGDLIFEKSMSTKRSL